MRDDAYVDRLRRWQHLLNQAEKLDEGVMSTPVDQGDVRDAAERLRLEGDRDWA